MITRVFVRVFRVFRGSPITREKNDPRITRNYAKHKVCRQYLELNPIDSRNLKAGSLLSKNLFRFSGNHPPLAFLLEYPGKTDGAAAGNLREPVLDRLFCFGRCGSPTVKGSALLVTPPTYLSIWDLKSEITGLSSTLCSPLFSLNKLERSTDSPSRTIALLRCC